MHLVAQWKHGKCTGKGILTHADGRRYDGHYLMDKVRTLLPLLVQKYKY
jgi:hypothetical protein